MLLVVKALKYVTLFRLMESINRKRPFNLARAKFQYAYLADKPQRVLSEMLILLNPKQMLGY